MPGYRNALRLAWIAIGGILVCSGLYLAVSQELYGKVRLPNEQPLMAGWPVTGLGLAEAALGVFLIWTWWRR